VLPIDLHGPGMWYATRAAGLVTLLLLTASVLRNRLGHRSWRRVYWLAYACWPIGLAHGLGIGTDRATTWVFALTVACAAAVAAAATWRLVTAARLGTR
jgi:methionine sulfoxide reductase heme-binding subunit